MTSTGYGISGIGFSPLGTVGLDSTGTYASYDPCMPSMIGLNYGLGMNNSIFPMAGMGMMGSMYGMYNPLYMTQLQQQMESSQLQHANRMHSQVLTNEVNAHRHTDSALMNKMLTNGDIQQGIANLYNKVREGDQDGICSEFDKLKNYVYTTYRDEIAARGDKINPSVSATQYIEAIYSNMASAWAADGQNHDLRSDIKRYGDSSTMNGFMSGFRRGHHGRYVDETLNHCFGLEIDQKGAKDMRQQLGKGVGRTASALEKGAYGAVAGVAGAGILLGLGKLFSFGKLPWLKTMGKLALPMAAIGTAAGIIGDICWQASKA